MNKKQQVMELWRRCFEDTDDSSAQSDTTNDSSTGDSSAENRSAQSDSTGDNTAGDSSSQDTGN